MSNEEGWTAYVSPYATQRDVHTITVRVNDSSFDGVWVCPHADQEFERAEDAPPCRRVDQWQVSDRCLPGELWADIGPEMFEAYDKKPFEITAFPLHVSWWWTSADGFWVAPYDPAAPIPVEMDDATADEHLSATA